MKHLSRRKIAVPGFEQVVEFTEESVGMHAIIAIHNTELGPACGGIRAYYYSSFDEALADVLKLAHAMTYKSAIAQTKTGGGKSVLLLPKSCCKTEEMLLTFAEAINYFEGRYYAGEDMGITSEDVSLISKATPYVVGLTSAGFSGDPSPFYARGVFRGIEAVCQKLWGSSAIRGKKIAIQGLGSAGMKLVQLLFWEGAELIVADLNSRLVEKVVNGFEAVAVSPEDIFQVECDIFSPCAIGGVLNQETIPHMKCRAIAGIANNQLLHDEDEIRLIEKKILYAPDFVINAGGLINCCTDIGRQTYRPSLARHRVDAIYQRLLLIFERSEKTFKSPNQVAREIAEEFLQS